MRGITSLQGSLCLPRLLEGSLMACLRHHTPHVPTTYSMVCIMPRAMYMQHDCGCAAQSPGAAAQVRPAPQYHDVHECHMISIMPAVQLHMPFPHKSPRKVSNTPCTVCPLCQGFKLCLALQGQISYLVVRFTETAMSIRVPPVRLMIRASLDNICGTWNYSSA